MSALWQAPAIGQGKTMFQLRSKLALKAVKAYHRLKLTGAAIWFLSFNGIAGDPAT